MACKSMVAGSHNIDDSGNIGFTADTGIMDRYNRYIHGFGTFKDRKHEFGIGVLKCKTKIIVSKEEMAYF